MSTPHVTVAMDTEAGLMMRAYIYFNAPMLSCFNLKLASPSTTSNLKIAATYKLSPKKYKNATYLRDRQGHF